MFGSILRTTSVPRVPRVTAGHGRYRPVQNNRERYDEVLATLKTVDREIANFVEQRNYDSLREIVLKGNGESPQIAIIAIAALAGIDKKAFELLSSLSTNEQGLDSSLRKLATSLQVSLREVGNEDPYQAISRAGFDSGKIKGHVEGPRGIADIAPMILKQVDR